MSFTLQQRFAAALEARGETLVRVTTRYLVYTRRRPLNDRGYVGEIPTYFYLGKSGAVRVGRTSSESSAVREDLKRRLLSE